MTLGLYGKKNVHCRPHYNNIMGHVHIPLFHDMAGSHLYLDENNPLF